MTAAWKIRGELILSCNCDVFCPEDGGPYILKPRFFGSREQFELHKNRDGFFVERHSAGFAVLGRFQSQDFGATLTDIPSDAGKITRDLIQAMIARAGEISTAPGHWWADQLNNADGADGFVIADAVRFVAAGK